MGPFGLRVRGTCIEPRESKEFGDFMWMEDIARTLRSRLGTPSQERSDSRPSEPRRTFLLAVHAPSADADPTSRAHEHSLVGKGAARAGLLAALRDNHRRRLRRQSDRPATRARLTDWPSGRPHRHTSNHRGRGNDPVVVLGRMKSAVAVNMMSSPDGRRFLRRFPESMRRCIRFLHAQTECMRLPDRRKRHGFQFEAAA
jgi:hypothetical protein